MDTEVICFRPCLALHDQTIIFHLGTFIREAMNRDCTIGPVIKWSQELYLTGSWVESPLSTMFPKRYLEPT